MWRLACALSLSIGCSPSRWASAPRAPEPAADPPPRLAPAQMPTPAEDPIPFYVSGPEPPEPPPRPSGHGSLDGAQVGALIENSAERFRACRLHGTALVRLLVGTNGKVIGASYDRESLAGGDKSCPLDVLRSLDFPAPEGGNAALVVPLVFRAKAP